MNSTKNNQELTDFLKSIDNRQMALEERHLILAGKVNNIESNIDRILSNQQNLVDKLDKFQANSRPNFSLLIGLGGLILSFVIAIGSLAFRPLDASLSTLIEKHDKLQDQLSHYQLNTQYKFGQYDSLLKKIDLVPKTDSKN